MLIKLFGSSEKRDFNRAEGKCYSTNFPNASSDLQNGPYIHQRLDLIL